MNKSLKLAEVRIGNLQTGTTLNVGASYDIGSIIGIKPIQLVRIEANRIDGGNAAATITVDSNASWKLAPLVSIPQGVTLRAHTMFFYQ